MAPVVFVGVDSLVGTAGRDLGRSAWRPIDAVQVTMFAAATGTPIDPDGSVPKLLALALTNRFLPELLEVRGAANGINYGAGRVRFPVAVKPGQRVRGAARILDAIEVPGGVQTSIEIRIEVDGEDQPACVVESLSRWVR